MIARLWRAWTTPDRAHVYREHLTGKVWPALRRIDGCLGGQLLERPVGERVECLVITQWASWEAIHAFAGDDPVRAVVDPDARAVLLEFDERVEHFEITATLHET